MAGDRAECARLQKALQAKLVDVQGELRVDRERVEAQFDSLLLRQEEEFRGRIAELTTLLVERDGQLRELGRELQAAKSAGECARRDAEERRGEVARVERASLDKERGLLERLNAQELKMVDSDTRLASAEARLKALQGEAARKLADADRDLREKERALVATREVREACCCLWIDKGRGWGSGVREGVDGEGVGVGEGWMGRDGWKSGVRVMEGVGKW